MEGPVEVKIEGAQQIAGQLLNLSDKQRKAIALVIKAGAIKIWKTARESVMHGPKTGRKYGKHRASAPGEAPANDHGILAGQITYRTDPDGMGASIVSRAKYSWYLEFGTRGKKTAGADNKDLAGPGFASGAIAPRPFMHPAYVKNEAWIRQKILDILNRKS